MARSWLTLAEPRRRLAPLSAAGRGGGPGRAPAGLAVERRAAGPAAHGRLRQRRRVRPAAGAASTWGRDPLLRRLRALAEERDRTRDRPPASRPGVMTGPSLSPALSTSIHRAVEPSWLAPALRGRPLPASTGCSVAAHLSCCSQDSMSPLKRRSQQAQTAVGPNCIERRTVERDRGISGQRQVLVESSGWRTTAAAGP